MSPSNPALPQSNRASATGSRKPRPLDGEVIPPTIRVIPPEREASAPPSPQRAGFRVRLSTALLASALAVTVTGIGGFAAYRWHGRFALHASEPGPTAIALAHLSKDVGDLRAAVDATRQDDATRTLKKSVDLLKAELDTLRASNAAAVAQLAAKLDRPVPTAAPAPGTADILARLDKLDHDPRMTDIATRLDRIEHQVSAPMPTGSVVPPPRPASMQTIVPQPTNAVAKPLKSAVLDNWIVRDVYSGIALVEGRSGSIREVVPGETLPGAGEVRSIERRGRNWVVVTSRGIIDTETW